jgi:hypothetical protein
MSSTRLRFMLSPFASLSRASRSERSPLQSEVSRGQPTEAQFRRGPADYLGVLGRARISKSEPEAEAGNGGNALEASELLLDDAPSGSGPVRRQVAE